MILKMNKQIFDVGLIETAVRAYTNLATIILSENSEYWICSFSDCKYSEALTVSEFENYVIDLMNCKHDDN